MRGARRRPKGKKPALGWGFRWSLLVPVLRAYCQMGKTKDINTQVEAGTKFLPVIPHRLSLWRGTLQSLFYMTATLKICSKSKRVVAETTSLENKVVKYIQHRPRGQNPQASALSDTISTTPLSGSLSSHLRFQVLGNILCKMNRVNLWVIYPL